MPALTRNNASLGTEISFGLRPEITSILKRTLRSPRSGLVGEICRGRANGAFMFAAWMMHYVSPEISGNYYVFDYAGNFPRKEGKVKGFSRKGLANRRDWARGHAIETLSSTIKMQLEDTRKFRTGETRTNPVNSTKDSEIRPWDIPIVAWENQLLIPTHWTELRVQFRAEETYRLSESFVDGGLPMLLGQGMILRNLFLGNTELDRYLSEPFWVWGRLKEVLLHQHNETRRHYEDNLNKLDGAVRKSFGEEAKVAFLAFSITDFRQVLSIEPRSDQVEVYHAGPSRKRKRQEMR